MYNKNKEKNMKKILLLIIFLIVFILEGSILRSNEIPSCENGWTSGFITLGAIELEPGRFCHITLFYCWRHNQFNQVENYIRGVMILDKTCLEGFELSTTQFWEMLNMLLFEYQANLPDGNPQKITAPPCPQLTSAVRIIKKTCWKWMDNENGEVILVPCEGNGYCIKGYALCWDYSAQEPRLKIIKIPTLPISVLCSPSIPYNPTLSESPCFSNCD